jgi:hypothetical protein
MKSCSQSDTTAYITKNGVICSIHGIASTQARSFKSVGKNKNTGNIQGLDAKYFAESLIINSIFRVP